MMAVPKLLLAWMAGAVALFLAVSASAAQPSGQTPPEEFPAQFFPSGLLSPVTRARAGAAGQRQLQGMHLLSGNGGGAERLVHDGHAGRRAGTRIRRRSANIASPSPSRSRSAASPFRSMNGKPASRTAAATASSPTTRAMAAAGCRWRTSPSPTPNPTSPGSRKRSAAPTGCRANPKREYFTRAGTTTAFWFGNGISPKQANYLSGNVYNSAHNA